MESAEQPTKVLHKEVGESLKQLEYHQPTIPPNEGPVLAEDLQGMIKDVEYSAKTDLEQVLGGGVTYVRTTESKNPLWIARAKQFLRKKIFNKLEKAA